MDNEAWKTAAGPTLLLAGPGTGKTHQLALRIKDLVVEKGILPESITVITFTKEAADNMRRRLSDEEKPDVYLPPDKRPERITTMHSLGLEIIRAHAEELGLPDDFRVMTDSRLRRILFRDASLLCGYDEIAAQEADMLRQKGATPKSGTSSEKIIQQYETILRSNKAIDYDDQILLAVELLAQDAGIRAPYSAAATHLLVDEYQDINPAQRRLIALLSHEHPDGLFVVGDDDQSIYSFRGGTPRYIREFHVEFGSRARVKCLEQSRRCTDRVIGASLDVVREFDKWRLAKPEPIFLPQKQNGAHVTVHNVASDDQEAQLIASIAARALPRKDVLILIPAKQYAERVKHALRKRRISYTHPPTLDDSGFALLQVIQDWIQHPDDNFALRICVEALCNSGAVGVPSKRSRSEAAKATRARCLKEIASLWHDVISGTHSLWQAHGIKAKRLGGLFGDLHERLEALQQVGPKEVHEFLSKAAKDLRPWTSIADLMKEVRVWLEELRAHGQRAEGGVRIMTLQAAKGLEADIVCVLGLNEGILPRQDASSHEIEESARLAYVSMTRAKEELHLFYARKRDASTTYLEESYQLKPSRFLDAIDSKNKKPVYHPAPSAKGRSAPSGAKRAPPSV